MAKIDHARLRGLVERFTLGGAAVGLFVGLIESAILFFVPRLPGILQPDVRLVIWFAVPAASMVLFGLIGLALGLIAARNGKPNPHRIANLVAAGLALAAAYVSLAVALVRVPFRGPGAPDRIEIPLFWAAVFFACLLVTARIAWRRLLSFFEPPKDAPPRALSRSLLLTFLALLLGQGIYLAGRSITWSRPKGGAPPEVPAPNIVLISLDAARADHFSSYGYARSTTPNLDRLASKGVLFENAVAPSPWTLTSHASMLTGLLPHQHGANVPVPIPDELRTLAEILRSYGYETAAFNANYVYGLGGRGLAQGFEVYEDDSALLRHNVAATLWARGLAQPFYENFVHCDIIDRRRARDVNRDVLRWLRRRSNRPFFLFVHYFDSHDPYIPPSPYNRRFGRISRSLAHRVSFGNGLDLPQPLSAEEHASVVAAYDNSLAYLDNEIGKLLAALAGTPEGSQTVFIATSDHGESFGEHGLYGHSRDLYREVLHVPLIIAGPGIPPGLRIPHPVAIQDVFATTLDLALGPRLPFRHVSLRRLWLPGTNPETYDEGVISELGPVLPQPGAPAFISLMTSEWQYIRDSEGREELFRWRTDPSERIDLAGDPGHQRVLQSLDERLRMMVAGSVHPWRAPGYLFALDRPGTPFLLGGASDPAGSADQLTTLRTRIGAPQTYFGIDPSAAPAPPLTVDSDQMKSLPYQ